MKLTYRPEIDGLRAIAVGAVIIYHAQITILGHQIFKGGFIGVDIFFVISGYLITSIILKELVTTGSFSFKYFYQRRLRRILPILLFVILSSLPIAWMYLLPNSLVDFSKSALYSLGFSSNFYFHFSGLEYAVDKLKNPLLHTWSLSVEEQYYIIFPVILLITFKYFKKYLIHILTAGFFISLGIAEFSSRNYPSASFYFLHTRMWELLAGSIMAYFEITRGYRSKIKILNLILPFIGIVLIGHSILIFDDEMFHPSFYTLSPIIGSFLIIWFSNKDELITKILSSKLFVGIGLISYSLYLWHYPIFVFVAKLELSEDNIFKKILIALTILILSIFSYYLIEKPFRRKKINFKKILLLLFVKLLIIIIFSLYAINLKYHPFLTKYNDQHRNFELNYNYNNFDDRMNIFIIGNSYADNLLNIFYNNKELDSKYYFYTAVANEVGANYQIDCLVDFFEENKLICDKNLFSSFKSQYKKSDFIIFAEKFNYTLTYLNPKFDKIINYLKKDKKKFIVFLDDLSGAEILDIYIHRKGDIPDLNDLRELEKQLFKKVINYKKNEIEKIKNKFFKNDIKFLTRSEIFCDYLNKKCPLIKNNEKLYSDYGHLTNNGAKFFSIKGNLIIEKLLKD
ncbi:acyltransferase [Candidatus Pelagibacter sp.]|nr:acyltransferase [Candidatus Pelagibacter sp.]